MTPGAEGGMDSMAEGFGGPGPGDAGPTPSVKICIGRESADGGEWTHFDPGRFKKGFQLNELSAPAPSQSISS